MKKYVTLLLAIALFSGIQLQAQQTGNGAASSSYTGRSNQWQNWAFAGGAVAAAVAGVIVIATNSSSNQISHAH